MHEAFVRSKQPVVVLSVTHCLVQVRVPNGIRSGQAFLVQVASCHGISPPLRSP